MSPFPSKQPSAPGVATRAGAVDFVTLAGAMGADGSRLTKAEEVEPAIRAAIASGRPTVIDCIIDSDDKVFPMVSPGGAIEEAFTQEDLDRKEHQ